MDDLQFNASLDALLANESLDTGQAGNSSSASIDSLPYVPSSQQLLLQQQQQQQQQQCLSDNYSNFLNAGNSTAGASGGATYGHPGYGQQQQLDGRNAAAAAAAAAGTTLSNQNNVFNPLGLGTMYGSHGSLLGQDDTDRWSMASSTLDGTLTGSKRSRGDESSSKGDGMAAVSEDEEEQHRRRQDRNMREQQRSQKITHQIDHLRTVLSAAQIRHKPDKFSTLVTVGEYIKQLQERSAMLDAEHKQLIDTITKTNELANEPHPSGNTTSSSNVLSPDTASSFGSTVTGDRENIYNEDEIAFVRNLDYKSIFSRCGIPLAVASIDGRFLDCNIEFETISGYKREEMLPAEQSTASGCDIGSDALSSLSSNSSDVHSNLQGTTEGVAKNEETGGTRDGGRSSSSRNLSLFNILNRDCMERVFVALSAILKPPSHENEKDDDKCGIKDHWCGDVRLNRNTDIQVSLDGEVGDAHEEFHKSL